MVENIPISLCYIYLSNNNVVFLYSNTENFPICLLSLLQRKDRQKDEDADDGHHQTANRTCRQREPEAFLARADHERNEAEDGGDHRQEDGDNLRVPRLDEGTNGYQLLETAANGIVLVQDYTEYIDSNF